MSKQLHAFFPMLFSHLGFRLFLIVDMPKREALRVITTND